MNEIKEMKTFYRSDSKPFKIIARGDCTSRRSVHFNEDLFPFGFQFIQNEKSPAIFHLDAINGISVTEDKLNEICDTSQMTGSLPRFYLGQANRSILNEEGCDLIIIDSYADMNFEIWEHKEEGWKVWIHPKFLRDSEKFYSTFSKLGRRTFEQSVQDIKLLVEYLRIKNPSTPVLFLNQQTDFYPKLDGRLEYYQLGEILSKQVPNSFFGGVIHKGNLKLADVGSCGPNQTLHFQAETYREMFANAFNEGLLINQEVTGALIERMDAAISSEIIAYASDNPEKIDYPKSSISFNIGYSTCKKGCSTHETVFKSLSPYIEFEGSGHPLRWTPAVVSVKDARDYSKWMTQVNKKYNRRYLLNRSINKGYFVEQFDKRTFIPDMWEIHNSTTVRSGGTLRGNYLKTKEEMGGDPRQLYLPVDPACEKHWAKCFGVFEKVEGHQQGNIVVDKRLLGYILFRRIGDMAFYSQLMGHADYLDDGIMYHLHFHLVEWASNIDNHLTSGLKFIMYGGVGNGGKSLWQWKSKVGFAPHNLVAINE